MAAFMGTRTFLARGHIKSILDKFSALTIKAEPAVYRCSALPNLFSRFKGSQSTADNRECANVLHPKLDSGSKNFSTSPAIQFNEEDDSSLEIAERIDTSLSSENVGRLFAVVHVSGKQRKITSEDIIVLNKPIEADIGERIRLNKVLLVGSKDFTLLGRPLLSPDLVRVEATVIEKTLSHTKVMFRYIRRKDYRKMTLSKVTYTYLRINTIELTKLQDSAG